MEEMLKSWFPNVKLQDELATTQTEEAVSTKKPKVKKNNLLLCNLSLVPRTYGDVAVKEGLKYLLLFNHRSGTGKASEGGLKAIFTDVLL